MKRNELLNLKRLHVGYVLEILKFWVVYFKNFQTT